MRIAILTAAIAGLAMASGVSAQGSPNLSRAAYVERVAGDGSLELAPAASLRKGDTVVFVLEWTARQRGSGQFVSSPVPPRLAFQGSSLDDYSVSTDGGESWGALGTLRITDRWGQRLASVEDVTHLRWRVPPGDGRLTFSAIVR